MASTYSTNLALELMATGEKANTWGDITNTNLGTLLEQAISGYVTQAITDGSGATTTITIPNGATGVARNMFIEMTGALTFSTTSLLVPANKKLYFIYNNTSGGFAVTVKVSGLTGVSVPNGQKMVLVSNGTDVVVATNYMAALTAGALTVSALTSGRVPYATTAGLLTDSASLTFNGTTLTANTIGAFTLSGTVAGGGNQLNNVIIGTTTPLAGFHTTVSATTSVTTPSVTNAGTLALSATSTNIITASTNGSERMRVDSSGNIDIGTTSNAVFDASGAARPLIVQKSDTSTTVGGSLAAIAIVNGDTTTSNTAQLNFAAITGASANQYSSAWISCIFGARTNTQYPTGQLVFATSTTLNSAPSEKLRIDNSGNALLGGTAARGTTVGAAHLDIFNGTAPAGTLTNGISLYSSSGDFNFMDSSGNGYKVGFRNVPAVGTKTASYTLATTDLGKYVQVGTSGAIVIPDATFAEGDIVSIFNNTSGNITITCTITTAYISGTDTDKATMTLATRGIATVFFISGTVCVVSGSVT